MSPETMATPEVVVEVIKPQDKEEVIQRGGGLQKKRSMTSRIKRRFLKARERSDASKDKNNNKSSPSVSPLRPRLPPLRMKSKMKRRPSNASSSAMSDSMSSTEHEGCVRFVTHKKKIKPEIIEFERVSAEELPKVWYKENDMLHMIDEVKHVVRHYNQRCDRYKAVLELVETQCYSAAAASDCSTSITNQFDLSTLKTFANAEARGLEQHMATCRLAETRRDIIRSVVEAQEYYNFMSPEQRELSLAAKYAQLATPSRLFAQTLGDGDALVADTFVPDKTSNDVL